MRFTVMRLVVGILLLTGSVAVLSPSQSSATTYAAPQRCLNRVDKADLTDRQDEIARDRCSEYARLIRSGQAVPGIYRCSVRFKVAHGKCLTKWKNRAEDRAFTTCRDLGYARLEDLRLDDRKRRRIVRFRCVNLAEDVAQDWTSTRGAFICAPAFRVDSYFWGASYRDCRTVVNALARGLQDREMAAVQSVADKLGQSFAEVYDEFATDYSYTAVGHTPTLLLAAE